MNNTTNNDLTNELLQTKTRDSITINLSNENNESSNNLNKAYIYAILSLLSFSLCNIHMKIISYKISTLTMYNFTIIRQLSICLTAFLYLKYKNSHLDIKSINIFSLYTTNRNEFFWMCIRSFLLTFGTLCATYAVMNIKQLHVTLIINLAPILSNILAPFIVDQSFKISYLYITFISFIGMVIMIWNDQLLVFDASSDNKNILLGTLSALSFALTIVITNFSLITLNKLYDSYNLNYISSFWAFLSGFLILIIIKGLDFILSTLSMFLLFNGFLNGLLMLISYILLYQSLIYAEVQKTSFISYLQIPIVTLFAYIAYDEALTFQEIIGGMILLGSIIYAYKYLK